MATRTIINTSLCSPWHVSEGEVDLCSEPGHPRCIFISGGHPIKNYFFKNTAISGSSQSRSWCRPRPWLNLSAPLSICEPSAFPSSQNILVRQEGSFWVQERKEPVKGTFKRIIQEAGKHSDKCWLLLTNRLIECRKHLGKRESCRELQHKTGDYKRPISTSENLSVPCHDRQTGRLICDLIILLFDSFVGNVRFLLYRRRIRFPVKYALFFFLINKIYPDLSLLTLSLCLSLSLSLSFVISSARKTIVKSFPLCQFSIACLLANLFDPIWRALCQRLLYY